MGCLRVKATECKYTESNRRSKEPFIIVINNHVMMDKLFKELTAIKDMSKVTSTRYYHRQNGSHHRGSRKPC